MIAYSRKPGFCAVTSHLGYPKRGLRVRVGGRAAGCGNGSRTGSNGFRTGNVGVGTNLVGAGTGAKVHCWQNDSFGRAHV